MSRSRASHTLVSRSHVRSVNVGDVNEVESGKWKVEVWRYVLQIRNFHLTDCSGLRAQCSHRNL